MITLTIILSALVAGVLGFLGGRRYERGSQELDIILRQEAKEVRGRRGTVHLNTMKVRR